MTNLSTTEARIIRRVLKEARAKNYLVSVHDGEEWTVAKTDHMPTAFAAIGTTDSTTLMFRTNVGPTGKAERVGQIYLVHGNDEDVIADCTDVPEILHLCAVGTGEGAA